MVEETEEEEEEEEEEGSLEYATDTPFGGFLHDATKHWGSFGTFSGSEPFSNSGVF